MSGKYIPKKIKKAVIERAFSRCDIKTPPINPQTEPGIATLRVFRTIEEIPDSLAVCHLLQKLEYPGQQP